MYQATEVTIVTIYHVTINYSVTWQQGSVRGRKQPMSLMALFIA